MHIYMYHYCCYWRACMVNSFVYVWMWCACSRRIRTALVTLFLQCCRGWWVFQGQPPIILFTLMRCCSSNPWLSMPLCLYYHSRSLHLHNIFFCFEGKQEHGVLYIRLSVHPSIRPSLSIRLSVHPSICLSVYLSIVHPSIYIDYI